MPSIASHCVVAKQVSKILNIKSDDYILGNILPDIIDMDNNSSHFKIHGKYYLIPDIDKFIENNEYDNDIFLGYLTHLLLDKYFLEDFIPNNIKVYDKINLFQPDKIYYDYTLINYILVKKYELDIRHINDIINICNLDLDKNKVKKNIESINSKIISNPKYINVEKYIEFLNDISIKIANEIRKWC